MSSLRIVVLGCIVRLPLGGLTWHYLHYLLGLRALGHDVWYVEDSGDKPNCYDPGRDQLGTDPSAGVAYIRDTFERVGLEGRWAYHDSHGRRWLGPASLDRLASADVLLNVSGVNPVLAPLATIPTRVLIDTDPGFTQVRHLTDPWRRDRAQAHTAYFTFGERIPAGRADVVDDGLPWQPTRQPVHLPAWPLHPLAAPAPWTSVLHWEPYQPHEHAGRRYGLKAESFAEVEELPRRVGVRFELGLGGPAPRDRLRGFGWGLRNPLEVTRTPWTYRRFIISSRAEIAVAKHAYVTGRTGWFSERSAAYLASGRPVLAQDTGFTDWLDAGLGVVVFQDLDSAVAGVELIEGRYEEHHRAARDIAEEYFAAERVLGRLLEDVGAGSPSPWDPAGTSTGSRSGGAP